MSEYSLQPWFVLLLYFLTLNITWNNKTYKHINGSNNIKYSALMLANIILNIYYSTIIIILS